MSFPFFVLFLEQVTKNVLYTLIRMVRPRVMDLGLWIGRGVCSVLDLLFGLCPHTVLFSHYLKESKTSDVETLKNGGRGSQVQNDTWYTAQGFSSTSGVTSVNNSNFGRKKKVWTQFVLNFVSFNTFTVHHSYSVTFFSLVLAFFFPGVTKSSLYSDTHTHRNDTHTFRNDTHFQRLLTQHHTVHTQYHHTQPDTTVTPSLLKHWKIESRVLQVRRWFVCRIAS